jgi:opacity protein-like surface antigen
MKKRVLIATLLAASVSTPAFAQASSTYLIGELGSASYGNMAPFANPGKLGFGIGFPINNSVAFELGFTLFGESTIEGPGGSATLKAHSFYPALVGKLPFNQQLSGFGKLGFAKNSAEITTTLGLSASTSQNSVYYGLGIQYDINSEFSLRGQYESFGDFDNTSSPMSASAVSLGIVFNF